MDLTRITELSYFFNGQVHGSFLNWLLLTVRKKFYPDKVFDFVHAFGVRCLFCLNF